MGPLRARLGSLVRELKRRHVFRVAVVYASVCFVLWQAAAVAFPALNLPAWTLTLVVVGALLGFPVALVLAWAFDLTPDGPRRTEGDAPTGSGVETFGDLPEPAPLTSSPGAHPSGRPSWVAYGVALLVFLLGAGIWLWSRPAPATATSPRVAVAVFENRTADPGLDPLGSMVADWVVRGIMRSSGIEVLDVGTLYAEGRTESGAPLDPRSLARRNGATLVVAGSYHRTADTLYFAASLIDVHTGRVLGTLDPVGAPETESMRAVDEVRQRISTVLMATLEPGSTVLSSASTRPPSLPAFQEFVAGQEIYWRGGFEEAIPYFQRASELDSTFTMATLFVAVAGAGVGRCDLVDSIAGVLQAARDRMEPGDARLLALTLGRCRNDWPSNYEVARARAAAFPGSSNYQWVLAAQARRARRPSEAAAILQALDPGRDLGWMSDRGKVIYWRELAAAQHTTGDFRGELRTSERMNLLDPGRLSAGYVRARSLAGAGRTNQALRALEALEDLSPDPPMVVSEIAGRLRPGALGTPGWVHYQVAAELMAHGHDAAGRIAAERGSEWLRSRAPEEAARPEHRLVQAQTLELLDRLGEAVVLFRDLASEDPSNVDFRGGLGVVAARMGDGVEALAVDEWLAGLPAHNSLGLPTLYRARIAAVLGHRGAALSLLEALPYGAHPVDPIFFHTDPALQGLRDHPRFAALVRNRD